MRLGLSKFVTGILNAYEIVLYLRELWNDIFKTEEVENWKHFNWILYSVQFNMENCES